MNMYDSQYGLQGRIVRRLAFIGHNDVLFSCLHCACAVLTALVFALIVWQIYMKYDALMAGTFYIVFLLSPWIVNFARNTYWLEFLWFIPMLIGLIFSNNKKNKWIRWGCYAAAFCAILIKALCGYEYITTIMLGLIAFLFVDLFMDCFDNFRRKEIGKDLIYIFLLGVCALAGFAVAVLIHANLRGDGNISVGIESIYVEDLLRSTLAEWRPEYGEGYQNSMNASLWSVLLSYFHRSEEIISGVGGHVFPLLSVSPVIILLYNGSTGRVDRQDCFLYLITFITAISWFVLGKGHSAMHGFLNFVLWNFGYIQICFYIIVKQFVLWVRDGR